MDTTPPNLTPTTPDTTQPLGQLFRQAREQQGLSLEQAAKQTFILKRHLEALENNDFDALPQLTYARGFAQSYGKFLQLDGTLVQQLFDAQYPIGLRQQHETVQHAPLQPMGTLHRDVRSGVKINPWVVVGALAALGLAIFIFHTLTKAHQDTQAPAPTAGVEGINPQERNVGADLNNAGSAINTTLPASVAPTTATSGELPANGAAISGVTPTASPAASSPAATATSQLDIWVQKPTQVQITDANGQTLLSGEQPRGAKNLSGKPPFTINIAAVSNVSLDLNKQPIDLKPYTQNNQANFSLSP